MRLLSFDQLEDKGIPFTRRHLEREVKSGDFPRPVPIGKRRRAWLEHEVDLWIEQRAALRATKAAA